MCCGAGFGEPIALLDRDLQALINCIYEIPGQWGGAGIEHSDGGEVVVGYYGGLAEHEDDGRDYVGESYTVGLDMLAEFFEGEGGHDNELEAGVEGLMN